MMSMKWAERSLAVRKQHEEPSLLHLEIWLKDRVLAQKEVYPYQDSASSRMKKVPADEQHFGINLDEATCSLCSESHYLGTKCVKYMALSSAERMEVARKLKLCFNCLVVGHRMSECSSTWRCLESECEKKHHTTLHEYFVQMEADQEAGGS